MASEQLDDASMELLQTTTDNKHEDVVSIDLPAPQGWTKKFIPKKGGTPRRNEIVFTAPTGEEIKTKKQLDQYLKSHLGGPPASEFDWGTGDSPRRSSRLSNKPKATETPESGSSRKKQKRSNSKKEEEKKEDIDGEGASADGEVTADKTEAEKDEVMKDAKVAENQPEEGKAEEAQIAGNPAEAPADNAEDKAGEIKQQDADSSVIGSSDEKETQLEERPEGEREQVAVQAPHKTAPGPGIKEGEPDGKAIDNSSEVRLPESVNAVEDQPAENEEEPAKELRGAQIQPEAAPVITVQVVDETLAADAAMGINNSDQRQMDLDEKVSSEEVKPDGNNTKENQEAANNIDNKPVNAGSVAPEASGAPPITC